MGVDVFVKHLFNLVAYGYEKDEADFTLFFVYLKTPCSSVTCPVRLNYLC
jgi:hypothetical protein